MSTATNPKPKTWQDEYYITESPIGSSVIEWYSAKRPNTLSSSLKFEGIRYYNKNGDDSVRIVGLYPAQMKCSE